MLSLSPSPYWLIWAVINGHIDLLRLHSRPYILPFPWLPFHLTTQQSLSLFRNGLPICRRFLDSVRFVFLLLSLLVLLRGIVSSLFPSVIGTFSLYIQPPASKTPTA